MSIVRERLLIMLFQWQYGANRDRNDLCVNVDYPIVRSICVAFMKSCGERRKVFRVITAC